jgi:tetratricopeptide (TPR) repeat protein
MTLARTIAALVAASAAVTLAGQETRQTFRSGIDAVMVDVSVRSGGRNVTGLRVEDFVLTDNGVRQRIEGVEATAVPLDVTIVVDLSGNPQRPWIQRRTDPKQIAAALEEEVGEVASILRPIDRIRLLTVDRYVTQVFPLQPADSRPPVRGFDFGGLSSMHDGLAAALLQPVEPARRHVVVARTKGADAMSVLTPAAVQAIASRSDALFHVVMMETALDNDLEFSQYQCNGMGPTANGGAPVPGMGLCWPTNRFFIPPIRRLITGPPYHQLTPFGEAIKAGAESTGGGWHQAVLVSVPSLTGTFRETFENFRSSYILRYTPQGVTRSGWHAIEVTLPNARNHTVSARKGYGVEERVPAPEPAAPDPNAPLRVFADFTAAYARGSYQQFVTNVAALKDPLVLMQEFDNAGVLWPGSPRREAAFALEIAEPALYSPAAATRNRAREMLDRVTRLLRQPLGPDDFEREWFHAALTLMQGNIRPGDTQAFIDRALERFPSEPRFLLLRAINTEQKSLADSRVSMLAAPGMPREATLDLARQHYEDAITHPTVAAEAHVRLAWLLQRAGKSEEALTHLVATGNSPIDDPSVRYLRQLFLGHVLVTLNRFDEAVAAFRGAVAVAPRAHAARVALMNALSLAGNRAEAESLSEQIQSDRGNTTMDPWWMYWQGHYRLHPQAMARLREMAR